MALLQIADGFPSDLGEQLRVYAQSCVTQARFDGGYDIIEFWYDSDPLLAEAIDHVRAVFATQLASLQFQQGWFFIYDTECDGVGLHADPGAVNVNIWLTPNECIADFSKNGLVVYDVMCPSSWTWEDYNTDPDRIAAYLRECDAKPRTIEYKHLRMTLFDSRLFHATTGVRTRPGLHNRRINCTLLFS